MCRMAPHPCTVPLDLAISTLSGSWLRRWMQILWHTWQYVLCYLSFWIKLYCFLSSLMCLGPAECPPPRCHWRPLGDCQVPHAQIWRQQVWPGQPCSKLSPQGSDGGPPRGGAVSHWGGRVWSQPQRHGKETCIVLNALRTWSLNAKYPYVCVQDDLDCFLLACYQGKLVVVQELVNRHKMDPHVVNEVCIGMYSLYVCVCKSCVCW